MAWVERTKTGEWRARWRDAAGKKHRGASSHKARSIALREAIDEEERAQAGQQPHDRKLTWGTWYEYWVPRREIAISTRKVTEPVINKWVLPYWAEVKLVEITPAKIREWIDDMRAQGASANTIVKAYHQLSSSLGFAVDRDKLRESPCHGIKLPKPRARAGMAFTVDEVEAIIEVLPRPYSTAVTILAFCGLRFGELAGMHWADVHDTMLWCSHVWDRHGQVIKPYPKDEDCRWVPLPNRVLALIERPSNWQQECGRVHVEGECPGQLVVPGPHGAALDSHNILGRHFRPAMVKAGIDPRRLTARQHDLRHTFITWLIEDGMSAEEVGPIVGHSSAWITARYTHLLKTHNEKARRLMNARGAAGGADRLPHLGAVGGNPAPLFAPPRRLRVVPE